MTTDKAAWDLLILIIAASALFGWWCKSYIAAFFLVAVLLFSTCLTLVTVRFAQHRFADWPAEKR